MTLGFLFWLLMVLWLLFGLFFLWPPRGAPAQAPPAWPWGYMPVGGGLLLWVLLFLLGVQVFGFPIKG